MGSWVQIKILARKVENARTQISQSLTFFVRKFVSIFVAQCSRWIANSQGEAWVRGLKQRIDREMAKKQTQKYQADGFALTFVSFGNLSRFSLHSVLVRLALRFRRTKHGFVGSSKDARAKWQKSENTNFAIAQTG
jgi:hypothetical protein